MLAYYEGKAAEEDTELDHADESAESSSREFARWLRIDFTGADPRCALHNDCHLHIGGLPGTRIVLDGVPNPKQFVELVMAWCYPEVYADHCLSGGEKGNYRVSRRQDWVHESSFPFIDDVLFQQVVHVRVPRR